MGIFFWKDNKSIDVFASALADELYSNVHPDVARRHAEGKLAKEKKKKAKVEQWLESVINESQKFVKANSLGIYGKARLQKQFSDRLLELGYDEETTRRIVEAMLFRST